MRQRQQEVRNELAAATTAMEQATAKAAPSNAKGKKDSKGSAGGGLSQQQLDELRDNKERLEAELTQLEVRVCFFGFCICLFGLRPFRALIRLGCSKVRFFVKSQRQARGMYLCFAH